MPEAVVVDTMVASAWLSQRPSERKARWAPVLGAEVAGWGARRRRALSGLIAGAGTMPPLPEVIDSYVDLRTWCARSGHGLGAKEHEAGRWVAAVALAWNLPLASDTVK